MAQRLVVNARSVVFAGAWFCVAVCAWRGRAAGCVDYAQSAAPHNKRIKPTRFARSLRSLARGRLMREPLAGPKNERSGPEKGRRAARPDSGLWGRESGQAGLLTRAFSRQRSASLRSLRAAADAPIVRPLPSRDVT
jgi:hypothetical protein